MSALFHSFIADNLESHVSHDLLSPHRYYLRSYCWLSVYAVALLHEGFGFPLHGRSLRWTQKMAGTDVTYALGAALYELNKLPWYVTA